MGSYLAIGLPHQIFTTPKDKNSKHVPSLSEVRDEMDRSFMYDMSLFDSEEREGSYVFTLKNELLKEGLIPFLESFYPKVYIGEHYALENDGYQKALETLRTTFFEQWVDFARDQSNYAFYLSTYPDMQYLEIPKDFRPIVRLRVDYLVLYKGSGKIITEGIDDFIRFFEFCFHEAFAEHPIGKAVEIYITC